MLKILWKRGEIAPQEQFLLFFTIFYNLILDFCVITRTRFFLRDKRLFEITEVEITRVDCIMGPLDKAVQTVGQKTVIGHDVSLIDGWMICDFMSFLTWPNAI